MKKHERDQYVKYRIDKAYEALNAAEVLIKNQLWSSAINRLYYASFHAIGALLVNNKIETKTHSGLKNQFSLHYIKSKKIDIKYGRLFSDLSDWRHQGDYADLYEPDPIDVLEYIKPVKEFIVIVENLIKENQ